MAKGDHWVSQRKDGSWAHKVSGNEKASGLYDTQAEAWEAAKRAARKDLTEAFLKGRDNQIRERNTYGDDPNPPNG